MNDSENDEDEDEEDEDDEEDEEDEDEEEAQSRKRVRTLFQAQFSGSRGARLQGWVGRTADLTIARHRLFTPLLGEEAQDKSQPQPIHRGRG